MLRRCSYAVTQQEDYLKWAISSNLDSQFILEVMNVGTQAWCWLQLNRLDDWINIFNQLVNNTKIVFEIRHYSFYRLVRSHLATPGRSNVRRCLSLLY